MTIGYECPAFPPLFEPFHPLTMHDNPTSKLPVFPSLVRPKLDLEEEFDQPLLIKDDSVLLLDAFREGASIANDTTAYILLPEAPPHLIRRAIKEFESGMLNELLLHKLLYLDRNSAEFREEYIKLRIESWMKPKRSFIPGTTNGAITGNKEEQENLVRVPPHLIRRAITEFENGILNELLLHKLLHLDRNTPEFRQEYIRLRVESLLIPRASSESASDMAAIFGSVRQPIMAEAQQFKNPWLVQTLGDMWLFFAPFLTILIALQLFYSIKLGPLIKTHVALLGNVSSHMTNVILALASVFTTLLVLYGCRGQDYRTFFPRLFAIGAVSAVIALASFVLPKLL